MATAGALVGASIAGLAYKLSGQNYILTFALATIPATMALVITCTVGASLTCERALCRGIFISGMCRIRQCWLCSAGMEIAIELRGMNLPQTDMCACRHLAALLDVPFVPSSIMRKIPYLCTPVCLH